MLFGGGWDIAHPPLHCVEVLRPLYFLPRRLGFSYAVGPSNVEGGPS